MEFAKERELSDRVTSFNPERHFLIIAEELALLGNSDRIGLSVSMSQEQMHKPEAFGDEAFADAVTEFQEQPMPTPESAMGAQHKKQEQEQEQQEPPIEALLMGVEQELKSEGHAVTYGDVFPAVAVQHGYLAEQAITTEDASLMQTAEAMAFGHTLKDGAASAMQSAAAKNVTGGWVEKIAHSPISEYGFSVTETAVPGAVMDIEYVAGQPVTASAHPTPTDPALAALDAVTIGEALEAAAMGAGDRPIELADARAIESAERRATGVAMPMKGGIGATAQSAAQLNLRTDEAGQTTLSDVLMDATADLPADKVVTYEDAYKVLQAELRGRNVDELQAGGVGATLVAAADLNARSGLVPPPPDSLAEERRQLDLDGEESEDDAEVHMYQPMESADLSKPNEGEELPGSDSLDSEITKILGTKEETTPLVDNLHEQEPGHGKEDMPAPAQTVV